MLDLCGEDGTPANPADLVLHAVQVGDMDDWLHVPDADSGALGSVAWQGLGRAFCEPQSRHSGRGEAGAGGARYGAFRA